MCFLEGTGNCGRGAVLTCTTILCRKTNSSKQALQVKKQPGKRTVRTALERSMSFCKTTCSHTVRQKKAYLSVLHANLKFHPYKMQVMQQLNDNDLVYMNKFITNKLHNS
jgi:hypothetical protein